MPSSTRPTIPGLSTLPQSSKRTMSDAESAPQDPKKARRDSSTEPSTRRDTNRDAKRRRKKKKKAPIVGAGISKSEGAQTHQLDGRTRAPLSARNEIIRFTSAPPGPNHGSDVAPAADSSSQTLSPKSLGHSREGSCAPGDIRSEAMPSVLSIEKHAVPANGPPEPSSSRLEDRIAQLEAELKSKNDLVTSHQTLLNQVQQAVICQVCLDLMYKPYALAPCGHLACHSCLVNWFTAPPPDNRQAPPAISRKKTCPHCRAVVRERPVEVWGVKSVAQAVGKSGLLSNQLPVPVDAPESQDASADPWKDIFPKPGHHGLPWFLPGGDIDDDDMDDADFVPRGEDVGMLDMEDGGIYRCLDCMHEIWDGVCSSCGRVYLGHGPEGDEEDGMGWLDDQMGAEEVDAADDPGWMGLEDGEADDGDDSDVWQSFRGQMFAHWRFLGAIGVDEDDYEDEDEDDDIYGRVDDPRVPDEGEDNDDEGYESSFIDDNEESGIAGLGEGPRIYEIGDEEDYHCHGRLVELASDDDEHEELGRSASLSEDESEVGVVYSRGRRARRVESDESGAYWSDA